MIEIQNLTKELPDGKRLLDNVSFTVRTGEFVGLLGASGAGKSLTIRCVLGLTSASSGEVHFTAPGSQEQSKTFQTTSIKGKELRRARSKIGVIFQGYNLVKRLTVIENVMLGKLGKINPLRSWIGGFTDEEALKALDALREVKMGDFAERLTGSLSGGEAQRVAIARAIFQEPALYIADEPISSLDPKNAKSIMKLLRPLADDHPVLGVFHQPDMVAKYCTRAIGLKGGRIVYDGDPRLSHEKLMEIYGEELEEIEQQQGVAKEPEKLADEAGDKQHFREGKEAKIAG